MEKLHTSIFINAPKEKVWDTMLADATYREWTSAFTAGSYYTGNWDKGTKMVFLAPAQDGNGESGLVSRIVENKPHEFMSVEHLGFIQNDVEDLTSDAIKEWAGAHENYTFQEKDGVTQLTIEMDVSEKEKEMMEAMWEKGLEKLKALAEK